MLLKMYATIQALVSREASHFLSIQRTHVAMRGFFGGINTKELHVES